MALFKGALDMKMAWLTFRSRKNVINFVYFGYFLISFVTRLKMVRSLVSTNISCEAPLPGHAKPNQKQNNCTSVSAILITLSILASLGTVAFANFAYDDWSMNSSQLIHSYQTSQDLFLWSPKNMTAKEDWLLSRYGTNLTTDVVVLASMGNILDFCGTLYANIMMDVFLVLSLEVNQLQSKLITDIESCGCLSSEPRVRIATAWKLYMKARDLCEGMNDIFGPLLKMIHTQNMFNLAYLLFQILTNEKTTFMFLMNIYDAAKLAFAYRLVKKCADKVQNLQFFECFRRGLHFLTLISKIQYFLYEI